jgi:L-lactate dehydrogenase
MHRAKIVIVGAGAVGGAAALFTAAAVPSANIVLVDMEPVRAQAQALDLAHASAFWGHGGVKAGDFDDAREADIVVVAAGLGVKPGQTRLDLAHANAAILCDIVDRIDAQAPQAIYVIATNPCDPLAAVAHHRLACARERVISTGTSLDTARLRALLAERLGVVAPAIEAYVLGEHGESAVIHWSGASVAGMPLELFLKRAGKELGSASRALVLRSVVEAAKQIKEGKGATQYGIAIAVARICQAIVHDSNLILSVGLVLSEVEGVPEVCVSLPMVLNATGANLLAYPQLDDSERSALQHSACIVKKATEDILARH